MARQNRLQWILLTGDKSMGAAVDRLRRAWGSIPWGENQVASLAKALLKGSISTSIHPVPPAPLVPWKPFQAADGTDHPRPAGPPPGYDTGGVVAGHSSHDRADNILARLTAGEFVEPVDVVNHYGLKIFEAFRKKRVPRPIVHQWLQNLHHRIRTGLAGIEKSAGTAMTRTAHQLKETIPGLAGGGLVNIGAVWPDPFSRSSPEGGALNSFHGSRFFWEMEQSAGRYQDLWESPETTAPSTWNNEMGSAVEPGRPGGWAGQPITDDEFMEKLEHILERTGRRRPQ